MSLQDGGRDGSRRTSTRNPRRRQRHESDSLGHQPRRKRSKITTETFIESTTAHIEVPNGRPHLNGRASSRSRKSTTPVDSIDMPVRSKKASQKRTAKGDGSTIMTQNAHYSLRHLPSTPDVIRNSALSYHYTLLPNPSYALAVGPEHAYIWNYTSATPVSNPRCFDSSPLSKPSGSTPIGALVRNGASSSIGLILVSTSSSGKIVFWENIDTAESLSLFGNKNTGVEGAITGLYSGEKVAALESAEHAGFVARLDSGRIVQIGLRDVQGKAKISAHFLRSNDAGTRGGLFGSVKGLLGVGLKRDIVAVRTRNQGSRGQLQVIALTEAATLQVWDLPWSGQASYRGSVDFKELLDREVARIPDMRANAGSAISLKDFAIVPKRARGDEVAVLGDDQPVDLVLLAQYGNAGYALVDVTLEGDKAYVGRATGIRQDLGKASRESADARLVVPPPGHTAFVNFGQKVVVQSLISPESAAGPEAQLLMEAHTAPEAFQDVLSLRNVQLENIVGEDVADNKQTISSAVLFIKGFGLARLAANEPDESTPSRPSAKSCIEQAIFYGTQSGSILDFDQVGMTKYTQDEIETAALHISDEVLRSETPFLSTTLPSIELQINQRQNALRALIGHLRSCCKQDISRETRYRLMSDAEKLAAGLALWLRYEDEMQIAPAVPTALPAVARVMRTRLHNLKISKDSEADEVRQFFIYDLAHLDQLCMQALHLVINSHSSGSQQNLMRLFSEADDIVFGVFETAFAFRKNEGDADYGFSAAITEDGVLEEEWEGLPEPWTATHEMLNSLDRFIDLTRNHAVDFFEKPENARDSDAAYIGKVVNENIRMVQILCKCYRERIAWCEAHYTEKYRNYAPGLVDKFKRSRDHHLRGLMKIGQSGAGLSIAEKYRDMDSLVRLVLSETQYLVESLSDDDIEEQERGIIQRKMDELQSTVDKYFREFGDEWAIAFFDSHLTNHRSFGLLNEADSYQQPLTRYLRAEPARGRLSWINEILNENDLSRAQASLQSLSTDHEFKLWNKKVESSLSKLTALAALEQSSSTIKNKTDAQSDDLAIIAIQESVYRHLYPTFATALDHDAEVQLVSDAYAVSIRRPFPALHQLLERAFDDLLNHKALEVPQLVDMLTLMDSVPCADPENDICGKEFWMALKVLEAAKHKMKEGEWNALLRVVWKRAFLADDWDFLGATKGKSDQLVRAQLRDSAVCGTLALGLKDVLTNSDSGITLLPPSACLGAMCSDADLSTRFPSSDLRAPILRDNQAQDSQLKKYIADYNLEKWIDACKEEAKAIFDEDAEAVQEEEEALAAVGGIMAKEEEGRGKMSGANGAVNGFHDGEEDESLDSIEHDGLNGFSEHARTRSGEGEIITIDDDDNDELEEEEEDEDGENGDDEQGATDMDGDGDVDMS